MKQDDSMTALATMQQQMSGQFRLFLAALTVLSFGMISGAAIAQDETANSGSDAVMLVEKLHEGLEHLMMNGQTLGADGASDYISAVVDDTYNLPALTAQSIGPSAFRGYDAEQKVRVVAAYRAFVISNYLSRFGKPLPINFETVGHSEGPRGSTIVETQLVRKSGDPVQLVYVVATSKDGTTGIADVQYNGVSEAARRRSELSSLARQGADVLADALNKKAAQIAVDAE
ncbi:ABC transporter substrate-binding protein [Pyruvatibacter sp.]|uniref:ABC transporter substrate-binding protein n=1 Tax=Pyruvatibacter sp. TaxID=1981328 RepID=UPI003264A35A